MTQTITNRYDFIYLFDCQNGNPNGDPDTANAPRLDPQDMHGLVSDVCLKRKVRNYILAKKQGERPYDIFIKQHAILNDTIAEAHKAIKADTAETTDEKTKKDKKSREQVESARQWICKNFYDVRTFGAVMSTGENAGQVRGPVQISFSRSIDPIFPGNLSITRMAVADAKSAESPNQTMGRKNLIPYGLFCCHGFISPNLAKETGFSEEDLTLFWEALENMFDHDRSASKGLMAPRKLIVFKHNSALGNAPAHKLFDCVETQCKTDVTKPRSFKDYTVTIAKKNIPSEITLEEKI